MTAPTNGAKTTTRRATAKPQEEEAPPVTGVKLLREPFPEHQIGKLPQPVRRGDQDKGRCDPRTPQYSADGVFCGGYHARSVHLDYVGHAPLTDRLLDSDEAWEWNPAYRDVDPNVLIAACQSGVPEIVKMVIENSPPLIDRDGGMYMKLTVEGITRLGYGDAQGKTGPNATKERIGDGLRNAGMRFGAALDLWHKGDLHADEIAEPQQPEQPPARQAAQQAPPQEQRDWNAEAQKAFEKKDLQQLLEIGKACNAAGQFKGDVKKKLLELRNKLEAPPQPPQE